MNVITLPSGKAVNFDNMTSAEVATWREAMPEGGVYLRTGVVVHFVGGSGERLIKADADFVRSMFNMK